MDRRSSSAGSAILVSLGLATAFIQTGGAQTLIGEEPALGSIESRITQEELAGGYLALNDIRTAGLKMFATQFRKADGYGDGSVNPADPITPGGRPMLQDNGTFLRVNGLDSQACLDCHSIVSADAISIGVLNNRATRVLRASMPGS